MSTLRGERSGRRGSNSRPLPWQGSAVNLYSGGVENGLKATTYPQIPRGSTLTTRECHADHTALHADDKSRNRPSYEFTISRRKSASFTFWACPRLNSWCST
jgi:hypothetical protein